LIAVQTARVEAALDGAFAVAAVGKLTSNQRIGWHGCRQRDETDRQEGKELHAGLVCAGSRNREDVICDLGKLIRLERMKRRNAGEK
jgi:hypothetical protein